MRAARASVGARRPVDARAADAGWPQAPASSPPPSTSTGRTRASTCATARRPAPRGAAARRAGAGGARDPPDRHRLRRGAVGLRPVAVRRRGQPVAEPPRPRRPGDLIAAMDARSIALLEFPAVRARLAERTSFDPSRRLAEGLEPSADPVLVARGAGRDRPGPRADPGAARVGIGAAHDIEPWIVRATRGGRLDAQQFLEIMETLDSAARLATSLADERRSLLRDLGRRLAPAARAARHARPQLRPRRRAPRHRLAPPRPAPGRGPRRLRPAAPARWTRSSGRSSAARSRSRS